MCIFVIVLVASIVVFIVCRELVMWYWNNNEIVGWPKRMGAALEANPRPVS